MDSKINKLYKARSNKVIISTENKQDIEMIKKLLEETTSDKLIIRNPIEKVPKLIIKNIEKDLNNDQIKEAIRNQNKELFNDDSEINIEYTYGNQNSIFKNAIVSTDKQLRLRIKENLKLYIGHCACSIENDLSIMHCTKCGRFGHKAKKCKSDKFSCVYCSNSHDPENCPIAKNKQWDKLKCSNCEFHNSKLKPDEKKFNTNHKSTNKNKCPIYKSKIAKRLEQINVYESRSD